MRPVSLTYRTSQPPRTDRNHIEKSQLVPHAVGSTSITPMESENRS